MKPPEFLAPSALSVPWHDSNTEFLSSQHCISSETEEAFVLTAKVTNHPNVQMSKDSFISTMGLLPKKEIVEVCVKRRNIECQSIDWSEDTSVPPMLSLTEKCLISNLNRKRDESQEVNSLISRKRCSLFSSCNNRKRKEDVERAETIEENYKEIEAGEERIKILHAKSFYRLDLTSPLGQLVSRHLKGDPSLHIFSDAESHCLTSAPDNNTATIQLRERHTTFPITFKGYSGKFNNSHVHKYSFTRRQKTEFMHRVNTGLDKKSRILFKKMKPCKVRLLRITKADLKRWIITTNEVMVKLKPLSMEEISYWTSPKTNIDTYSLSVSPGQNVKTLSSSESRIWKLKTDLNIPNFDTENHEKILIMQQISEMAANKGENLYSNFIINRNEPYGSENSSTFILPMPIFTLKRLPLSPGPYTDSLRKIHILPDRTNFENDIRLTSAIKCHTLCPVSHSQNNDTEIRMNSYSFYSYKCIFCSRNISVDSCFSDSTKCSNLCTWSSRLVSEKTDIVQHKNEPRRSGIYNVHISTSEEGKIIKNVVLTFNTESENEHSRSNNTMELENISSVVMEDKRSFTETSRETISLHEQSIF